MTSVSLETATADLRAAIESASELEPAAFARRTRNAIAQAVIAAAAGAAETLAPPDRCAPVEELLELLDPELATLLAAVYDGGAAWKSHAIDALEPLHALAQSGRPSTARRFAPSRVEP